MKTLNLNSFEFQSIDHTFRVTIAWSRDKLPNLHLIKDELNIIETRAYELDNEQLEFSKKYHAPFKHTYYSLDEINKFILLLEEYEELITEAEAFKLSWDFNRFDFEGLKEAVEQKIEGRSSKE